MDYLFFGINSLAAGLAALLLFQQFRPTRHLPLKLVHYLAVFMITVAYFSLDQLIFSQVLWGYLLANSLPIVLFAGSLFTVLKPQATTRT
ncbi:MAG: hypothetical protein EOM70_06805 [Clostridia bacterium]|nr:hypothetical protein [Clostridia bacterium]